MFTAFQKPMRSVFRQLGNFRADTNALAAVEFAMILPVLLVLYIGSVEVTQAISVNRKVTHLASSVADLVTQTRSVSSSEMTDIFTAATPILNPYDTAPVKAVVAAVDIDGNGQAKVAWSVAHNSQPYAQNSPPPVTIPAELLVPNTQIVIGQVEYKLETTFSGFMKDLIGKSSYDFDEIFLLKPRLSDKITYTP